MHETELFAGRCVLTNASMWSPDSCWIAFDTRSDPAGSTFDGTRIQMVNVETREIRTVYESANGAHCGVVTFHPTEPRVAFILGPEFPTAEYRYGPSHRRGVIAVANTGSEAVVTREPVVPLDARDLAPPFTAGALRGGSHVHIWNPFGDRISFTYEDDVVGGNDRLRTIGVSLPNVPVTVPKSHPRNHDGRFSFLAVKVVPNPTPGSDEIRRAVEEAWIGSRNALAFQGFVRTERGDDVPEVFIAELPEEIAEGDGPLEGTSTELPAPPHGTIQRRLTFTTNDSFPGVFGPRHWLRSSPDGLRIAFLKRDPHGVPQLFAVSPNGGAVEQLTDGEHPIASAFTWHPSGEQIAFARDGCVCSLSVQSGKVVELTERMPAPPRPEACVISPDGKRIAFVRHRDGMNRLCVANLE